VSRRENANPPLEICAAAAKIGARSAQRRWAQEAGENAMEFFSIISLADTRVLAALQSDAGDIFRNLSAWAWIGIIFAIIVAVIAQIRVSSMFGKYSRVPTQRGMTGAEVARQILREAGIYDVEVSRVETFLGDHYDPRHKRLCLSPGVYDSNSVAAAGIAAHECGHAIQHQHAYIWLQARMAVVPVTMVASQLLPFIMFGGFFFGFFYTIPWLLDLGIGLYAILTVFQLITLPVEFDASRRAKLILADGIITPQEGKGVSAVLNAAALTYVAAFLSALFHLLHLIALRNRN
jgi:Zn-dependent membrane protease YugP